MQIASKMRGGGKHKGKLSKAEKERSRRKQKAEYEPNLSVDAMYVLMDEQMRSVHEYTKSFASDTTTQRICK